MTIGTTPAMEARVGHVPRMRPPALRGKVHAACLPLVAAAGIVLVVLAPGAAARGSVAVYGACAVALFAASSAHHLLTSAGRPSRLAERADHAAIFLIIAGTYTPFVILGLGGATRVSVLTAIWVAAAGGAAVRLLACPAPRWLFALLYLTLGWIALSVLPRSSAAPGPGGRARLRRGRLLQPGGPCLRLAPPRPRPTRAGVPRGLPHPHGDRLRDPERGGVAPRVRGRLSRLSPAEARSAG